MLPPGMDLTPAARPRPASVDGVLKFGPDADAKLSKPQAVSTTEAISDANGSYADAETEDLLYSDKEAEPQRRKPALSPLSDISQHPIEISVE